MQTLGKRTFAFLEYDLSVDDNGKIQELHSTYWGNVGASFNETHSESAMTFFQNCYDPSTWKQTAYDVKTDMASNTFCRAPGGC